MVEEPLPSWNEGAAKRAIIDFVRRTCSAGTIDFVPKEERVATFDQDGTLWVEKPIYTQLLFCFDKLAAVAERNPDLKNKEPYKTVLSRNIEKISKLSLSEIKKIVVAVTTEVSVEEFQREVREWMATARDPRWHRLYSELTYQPMQEVMRYLRSNGYKTYIVTGGGQDFVRAYAEKVYDIPPEQVVGTALKVRMGYGEKRAEILIKDPKLLLNDNNEGKVQGIHFLIGRRPYAAFGNSVGDREMLEYTFSGKGKRLAMLLLHDDERREYAYGPAENLPDSKVGTFTQALYEEAKEKGWTIISIKSDWKRLFSFDTVEEVIPSPFRESEGGAPLLTTPLSD